ncbi:MULTISPECIES: hypothetical protein [Romboutsia]|uniref:Uncharacterized protein n=1 Tax=Romboutsia hominis TaxID=1507512 RepID=A0A2P2BVG1_9FIRM|nr:MULTISPECIES: hypothetical protein [Romboutsia]MCH1958829.1 hypothetical protein [Romboutsia hominis]MCH1970744.1 hypothetical protein [Romboutsia hominis]MDB8790075.1 hypothetical protein [Romboutsia sp. 1001216sp1]MDB8794454.1 hypothetical protein [Romboutsia sp. 1001216sp1]MDB8797404.1 hypothetical protein [Romboutsia sp. 1001216sp1]
MYSNNKDDIKKELKSLCADYVNILEKLKKEKIISEETYNTCSLKKISFLEE